MGKILRIGVDTVTNYTLQETSAYNSLAPAATVSPWPDSAAMDQSFTMPAAVEVTAQGALVTFTRFPDAFEGARVKLHPTYDTSTGEDPFFEMWIHDSVTTLWTLRFSVELSNPFNGIVSGQRKILDFTFFPFDRNVDKVWLTMNPGSTGAPSMNFMAIHLYGQCEGTLRGDGGPNAPQTCDKTSQWYTGFIQLPDGSFVDCPADNSDPTPCDIPDLCNPASVAAYRECLRAYVDNGTSLAEFDGWYQDNRALINSNCEGNTDTDPPTPMPEPPAPIPFPDLCDDTAIDAYRAAISGNADALAAFNAFIDTLTAAGYFDLVCPADDPTPVYVDPTTMQPAADPADDPILPFHTGPGAEPPPTGSGGVPSTSTPAGSLPIIERTSRFILNWSGTDRPLTTALANGLVTPLPASTVSEKRATFSNNYGPNVSIATNVGYTPAVYGLIVHLNNIPFSCFVGLRMRIFWLSGSPKMSFSISNGGIHTEPIAGFCPLAPDWIITPTSGLALAGSPNIGDSYYEYIFTGNNTNNQAVLQVLLPRVNAAQNDALPCTAGFQARNRHVTTPPDGPGLPARSMAMQRSGCLAGLSFKERDRWLSDTSMLDLANSTFADYLFRNPLGIIFDITLRAALVGQGFDLGNNSSIALSTIADAQPVETCP